MRRHYEFRMGQDGRGSWLEKAIGFVVAAIILVVVLSVGLWLLGIALGIVVPLLQLALALAPVIIIGWLIWSVVKAIFV